MERMEKNVDKHLKKQKEKKEEKVKQAEKLDKRYRENFYARSNGGRNHS